MLKRLLVVALGAYATGGTFFAQTPDRVDYVRDVQPILRQNCYGCHGPRQQNNNLRLDRRRDALRGGTVAVIGPGNSEASHLYLRLVGKDTIPGQTMPPTGALTPQQIATIKAWIDQGAEWPDTASGEAPSPPPDPKAIRLMNALRTGDDQTFKALAAEPKVGNLQGPGGSTPLMFAVLYGDRGSVKQLLDGGADPNVKNESGATALMWAVNDFDKTRLLIDHGADVNAHSEDRRTPLMIASGFHGAAPVVRLLLEHGADVNARAASLGGETMPLTEAAAIGDADQFRLLIDHGADVNAGGPLVLGLAMRAQCMTCVELALKTMSPELLTPTMVLGGPPLGPALATPFLLEHGADIHARDPLGRTLLMLAAASDAMPVDVVKLLLAKGVDVNATATTGETALSLAKLRGETPIVDLLVKAGAHDVTAAAPMARPVPARSVRVALDRALPLLQRNDEVFLKKAGCVSCHNNTLTAVTVATARKKGLRIDSQIAQHQLTTIGNYIDAWRERALQGNGIPGDADTVSYILWGLAAEGFPADAATDAMAIFLMRQQTADGSWRIFAHRPPIESSDIEVTALSMRAIQVYAPRAGGGSASANAVKRAGAWLAQTSPRSTEDHALRLLGLSWAGAPQDVVRTSAGALIAAQRPDGGWSQLSTLSSDAYATGQALVALAESGALLTSDAAYRRGVNFLLRTQFADGSWFVKSRAIPLQPHFETGFPFGHDQFISAAGTNWAARALALAYTSKS